MTDYHVLRIIFDSYEQKKMFERKFQVGHGSRFPKILLEQFSHGDNKMAENEMIYYMGNYNFRKYLEENSEHISFAAAIVINHLGSKWSIIKPEAKEVDVEA